MDKQGVHFGLALVVVFVLIVGLISIFMSRWNEPATLPADIIPAHLSSDTLDVMLQSCGWVTEEYSCAEQEIFKIGDTVSFLVNVHNIRTIEDNGDKVMVHLGKQLIGPDGTAYFTFESTDKRFERAALGSGIVDMPMRTEVLTGEGDPLGDYLYAVRITDTVSGETAETEVSFTLR